MYGKIFDSIYDGTLADDWRALITFQQMIVMCDQDGNLDMTPTAISRKTGIPIEHIKAGIELLENPDPYSRTEGEEGRRIILIDDHRPWGWHIVNHNKYVSLQDMDTVRAQTRERVRKHRAKKNSEQNQASCNDAGVTVTPCNSMKRHIDIDIDIDKIKRVKNTPPTATKKSVSKKKKKAINKFKPPTLSEVQKYAKERNSPIDPDYFHSFYDAADWEDVHGNKIKSWKQKFIVWTNREKPKEDEGVEEYKIHNGI